MNFLMKFLLVIKNRKMKTLQTYIRALLVIGLFLTVSFHSAMAQPVPENAAQKMVVDNAGVFSAQEIQYLEQELEAFSDSTSNQIVVVTMNDFEGYDKWEVAQNIGKTWGVGHKEDNGVVVLIKPKVGNAKGQIAIQVGYGLEGAIPDATAKMIVDNEVIPYFKQGRMFDGVENGVMILKSLSVGEYNSDQYASNSGGGSESIIPFLFMLMVVVFIFAGRARSARTYGRRNNLPFWTAMMLMSNTGRHGGSYNNFTSGGGGFGGGGFGGGGAGGSW